MLGNIGTGIVIVAVFTLLELLNKEYEEERKAFES